MKITVRRLLCLVLTGLMTALCCPAAFAESGGSTAAPDYAEAGSWVSRPEQPVHGADTFFILPTVNMKDTEPGNEDITDEKKASRFVKTLGLEGGIVSESTDVYAPFYRQVTLGCYIQADGMIAPDYLIRADFAEYTDIAYGDIRNAWLYYMEHDNNGRPVVLFGYSQGSEMILRLLEEFGDTEAFKAVFVAAYVIGAQVDGSRLDAHPALKMAQGETDTGVIVSYNAVDARMEQTGEKEYAINPLNWRTDSTPAEKEQNLGFVTTDVTGKITEEVPAYCGATLDAESGRLVVTGAEDLDALYEASGTLFHKGDYHLYDLNFFYRNLQKNIADRVAAFSGS